MEVYPPLRRRQVVLLRLGQRREGRLQQGFEDAGRMEHHPVPQARARTSWPPRSTAGRTAPISSARTSGGWPASSATSISTAAPKVRIRDFEVRAGLDSPLTGTADWGCRSSSLSAKRRRGFPTTCPYGFLTLLDAAGKRVFAATCPIGRVTRARGTVVGLENRRSTESRDGARRRPHFTGSSSSSGTQKGRPGGGHVEDRLPDVRDQGRAASRQRRGGPAQGRQPPRARSRTPATSFPRSPCGATSSS